MWLIFVLTTVCLVLVWFYTRWVKVRSYWSERNVPYMPPNPFMGNLTFLQRQNPAVWMREIYKSYKTPYLGIWLFWRPAIVINSPELAKQILIKDAANFKNKFMTAGTTDPLGSLSVLFLKDPAWTDIRRRLSSAFTSSKLKSVQKIANTKCLDLVQRIDRDKDKRISLRTMFADYTTDIFSMSSFEIYSNATLTGEGAVREVTKDLMKFTLYRGISWTTIFFWPEIADLLRLPFLSRKSQRSLRCIFKCIFERKENEPRKVPRSLLDVLMLLKEKSVKDNEVFSDDFIISQAAILLIGGFDTSAVAITYIVYQLAFFPDIQEKLYKELSELEEKHGENLDSIISESKYIVCVIKESLRLFPPMSWLDRTALHDYKVDENLTIKAGMPVYINGVGMHMDPEYFPDPYKFDPDRFLPENEARLIPYTYLPFGAGPRVCIGQRFGMIALSYAVAAVSLNYTVEPYPNSPEPLEVKIGKRSMFLIPGEDIKVKFIPRR